MQTKYKTTELYWNTLTPECVGKKNKKKNVGYK